MMRVIGLSSVVLMALAVAPAALAQSSGPSAAQIIQALKPTNHIATTTRGIVPLPAGPAGSAAPRRAMSGTKVAARVSGAPSINLNIDFATGSATLTPQARTELNRLGHALTDKRLATYKFKVVGHTDTTGSATTNMALSQARAQAVGAYLQSRFDIPATRLSTTGVGEQDLLVKTGPNTPNEANRRVQIINIGK